MRAEPQHAALSGRSTAGAGPVCALHLLCCCSVQRVPCSSCNQTTCASLAVQAHRREQWQRQRRYTAASRRCGSPASGWHRHRGRRSDAQCSACARCAVRHTRAAAQSSGGRGTAGRDNRDGAGARRRCARAGCQRCTRPRHPQHQVLQHHSCRSLRCLMLTAERMVARCSALWHVPGSRTATSRRVQHVRAAEAVQTALAVRMHKHHAVSKTTNTAACFIGSVKYYICRHRQFACAGTILMWMRYTAAPGATAPRSPLRSATTPLATWRT